MRNGGERAGSSLRIAYLFQQFPVPSQTFAASDIAALIAHGHEVSVHVMKARPADEEALLAKCGVPGGLKISRPSLSGGLGWPALLWRRRRDAATLIGRIAAAAPSAPLAAVQALLCIPRILEIESQLERDQCDVVHAFWARHIGLVLPVAKARHRQAVRSAFVGAYDLVADDFLVEMTAEAADVLFSHAEVNRPYLEKVAPSGTPIAIVHRGIPLLPLGDEPDRDPHLWVTASSLIPGKNVEAVIRAFADARASEPRLRLRVFGDGPDRSRLARISAELGCSGSITFDGHIAREQLFRQMQGAAVFLLMSKNSSERLPNVVKEALWAGCAVISSNSEGIEELIPDSSIGHVVDPDDKQAVAGAVSAVLAESEADGAERRANSRRFIAENFSSDSSMGRYVEEWRRIAADLSASAR